MSKLDPKVYGPAESAITKEIIEQKIGGLMTLDEVMQNQNTFTFIMKILLIL